MTTDAYQCMTCGLILPTSREWKEHREERHDLAVSLTNYGKALQDAGLGVGHIWTNVQCPAYRSFSGEDCTCSVVPS